MQYAIVRLLSTATLLLCLAATGQSFAGQPAGMKHFARTGDEEVVAACTGMGPTGTTFVNVADDPRKR